MSRIQTLGTLVATSILLMTIGCGDKKMSERVAALEDARLLEIQGDYAADSKPGILIAEELARRGIHPKQSSAHREPEPQKPEVSQAAKQESVPNSAAQHTQSTSQEREASTQDATDQQEVQVPEGTLLFTGRLIETNGNPVAKATVLLRGALRTFDSGGIGFFMTETDSNGSFRLEVDTARMDMNEDREVTIEAGVMGRDAVTRTFGIRDDLGVPIVYKLDSSVSTGHIPVGTITVTIAD